MKGCVAAALVWFGAAIAVPAAAQDPPASSDVVTIRYSIKASALGSQFASDLLAFPESESATALGRFRLEPSFRLGDATTVDVALEQRARVATTTAGFAFGAFLPSEAPAPFRIRQLDWSLASTDRAEWRAEIDRAALHTQLAGADVTLGRQAIGWGRGALFGAIDLFAPFTPLEADREWRRGVDAARGTVKLTERSSIEGVGAFGDAWDRSAVAGRFQQYAGRVDVEVAAGRRARDLFGGFATSAAIGDIELHGEAAWFQTPAVAGSTVFGVERTIAKAVAGGSYRVPIGQGLLVYVEYHYSGFGAASVEQLNPTLTDPEFQMRLLRGDTQIIGRHVAAMLASYEWTPELAFSTEWVHSPIDGSGVLMPTVTFTASDHVSAVVTAYGPYGKPPASGILLSQFGAVPRALFVQLRIYR